MPAWIVFRSLTYAQRGSQILKKSGVPSDLVRAKPEFSANGCAYALRLRRNLLSAALRALREAGFEHGRVFEETENGFREVSA